MPKKKTRRTKYQILQRVKTRQCKGTASAADFNAAARKYIEDAVKKGKTKREAQAVVARLRKRSCKAVVGKKRKTKKRKTRRRAA